MKIFTDDRDVPYKTTKIQPIKTKADIDGILAKWGITKVAWDFDIENNKVVLQFQFNEKFKDMEVSPVVRLEPPRIWDKRKETINWMVSMRVFHWYIKTTLEMAYAMQSEKTLAFLPFIETKEGKTVKDTMIPELTHWKALEHKEITH